MVTRTELPKLNCTAQRRLWNDLAWCPQELCFAQLSTLLRALGFCMNLNLVSIALEGDHKLEGEHKPARKDSHSTRESECHTSTTTSSSLLGHSLPLRGRHCAVRDPCDAGPEREQARSRARSEVYRHRFTAIGLMGL